MAKKHVREEQLLVMSMQLQLVIFMNVLKYTSKLMFVFTEGCD